MRYCFDIDGTLCHTPNKVNGKPDYHNAIALPLDGESSEQSL